jgi:hypothetical protein
MKTPWQTVEPVLDQLFFLPLADNETPELRDQVIRAWLAVNGYSWSDVIEHITMECLLS